MNYIPRPGIVRTEICGVKVLIPSRLAAKECASILPISFFGAVIWAGIETDQPIENVLRICRLLTKKSDEELIAGIEEYCAKLVEKGYALPKPASTVPLDPEECHECR